MPVLRTSSWAILKLTGGIRRRQLTPKIRKSARKVFHLPEKHLLTAPDGQKGQFRSMDFSSSETRNSSAQSAPFEAKPLRINVEESVN